MDHQNKKPGKPGDQKESEKPKMGDHKAHPQNDDASMSSGNLMNNPRGRTKTRDLHTKNSITGSDDDGQAD